MKELNRFIITAVMMVVCLAASAQDVAQIPWTISYYPDGQVQSGDTLDIIFMGIIPDGLKMYTSEIACEMGPFATSIQNQEAANGTFTGGLESIESKKEYDEIFECDIYYFEHEARFVQKVVANGNNSTFKGVLEYQICLESGMCILQREPFTITLTQ